MFLARCIVGFQLALLLPLAAAGAALVDPKLREAAGKEETVPVLILLHNQPQTEILRRVEGANELRKSVLEGRLQAALHRSDQKDADALQRQIADESSRVRTLAFREIHEAIDDEQAQLATRITRLRGNSITKIAGINLLTAWIPSSALTELENDPAIAEIALSQLHKTQLGTSVPATGAPTFWNLGFVGGSQAVAVIDTGIRPDHPAFRGVNVRPLVSLESGRSNPCFGDDANSATDQQLHGTHVNGIVAGRGITGFTSNFGVARGLGQLISIKAGFRTKPVAGRCEAGQGLFSTADWVNGIDFIAQNTQARVINMSLGGSTEADDDLGARIVDYYADTFGITFAIAAGNEGPGQFTVGSPGIAYNPITVANVDTKGTTDKRDDTIATSSSRGPTIGQRNKPDIAAPGTNIRAADLNSDSLRALTGTSMASPHVAGAVALLRDSGIQDPLTIKALMINSADPVASWQTSFGWGFINLTSAQAQRDNVFRDAIPAGRMKYYRGSANGLRATLVWNRRFVANPLDRPRDVFPINNLDLALYNRRDNTAVSRSATRLNNVEVVLATSAGDYVVKVESNETTFPGGQGDEPFALALTSSGFTEARGPAPELTCTAPENVGAGANFTLSCTARNNGDLDLFRLAATPRVPAGFTGAIQQTFGALAPGQSQTLTWNLRASGSGGEIQVEGTGAAFDETYPVASNAISVGSGGSPGITVNLSQTSIVFAQQTGAGLAAAQSIAVSATGGSAALSVSVATSSGGNWLTATLAGTSTPATLSIRPATSATSLAAGSYSGTVTLTAAGASNSPLVVAVRIDVSPVASSNLTVENPRIARTVNLVDGCPLPAAVTLFNAADTRAFFWFIARGARTGDVPTVEWIRPDGSLYDRVGLWSPTANGAFCYAPALSIDRIPQEIRAGSWRVRLLWNGQQVANLSFTIVRPPTITAAVLTGTKDDPGSCDLPEQTTYRTTDEVVKACFMIELARAGDAYSIRYIRPDGTRHGQFDGRTLTADVPNYFVWQWYAINGFPVAGFTGDWKVEFVWNGAVIRTLTFRLNPPVSVEATRVTNANPDSLGCTDPGGSRYFLPRDRTATMWFSVADAVEGDIATAEFIAPDGSVYSRVEWDPLESGGSWCMWTWIDINGTDAARMFGNWSVRVSWNSARVINQAFQMLPVDVTGFMVTRQTMAGSLCSTPIPNTSFLTTDPQARLWFTLDLASAGDQPEVQWLDPRGALVIRSNFAPVSEDGSWCFASTLSISGQNRTPGVWTARALWNGTEVGRTTFQIERPGNEAPLISSNSIAANADATSASLTVSEETGEARFRGRSSIHVSASIDSRRSAERGGPSLARTGKSSGGGSQAHIKRTPALAPVGEPSGGGSGAGLPVSQ
jgi:serine protease AprX